MGLFNFFKKSPPSHGSAVIVTTKASKNNEEAMKNYTDGNGSLANSAEEGSLHTSELVFSCVDYIAKAASQAVPRIGIVDKNGKLTPLKPNDKLNEWVKNPNPFFTWGEMIELQVQALLLSGTSFMTLEQNKGKYESWFLGAPSSVKIVPHATNYIEGVIWKDTIAYKNDEVCITRNPTINNLYYGVPAVRPLLDTLNLESYAVADLKSFYENSSMLTGILESEYALAPDQVKALQDQFASLYGTNGSNRGGTAILPGGLNYKPIQSSPSDSKILDSLAISDKRVLRVFKINALALGGENTSTSKPQDLMKSVFNTAVRPYLYRLEDSISLFLQNKFKNTSLRFEFDLDRIVELETSLNSKADAAKTSYSTGLSTLNEARDMIGLPQIDAENANKNILAAYLFGTGAQYIQDGTPLVPGDTNTTPTSSSGNSTSTGGAGSTDPQGGTPDTPTAGQ
jgi:HK97 family phage portal protein